MKQVVLHGDFKIEKFVSHKAEKVFRAFSDPVLKRKWFSDGKEVVETSYESDFRVGGKEISEFKVRHEGIPGGVMICRNTTYYLDIVENSRVVFSYTMAANGKPFSASLSTIQLIPTDGGTNIVLVEQGAYFENSDGIQMRKDGWEKLISRLVSVLK